MSAETLLSRLQGVRKTGPSKWIARCPAHQDRSPSLCITEKDDGTVLIWCGAQCGAEAVLQAVGLEFSDLFPKDPAWKPAGDGTRHKWPAHAVLAAVADEAWIVFLAAQQIVNGPAVLTQADRDRVFEAAQRISRAREMATGKSTPHLTPKWYPPISGVHEIDDYLEATK